MSNSASARPAAVARRASRVRLLSASLAVTVALAATVGIKSVAASSSDSPRFHGSGNSTGAWLVQFRGEVADIDATTAVAPRHAEAEPVSDLATHPRLTIAG